MISINESVIHLFNAPYFKYYEEFKLPLKIFKFKINANKYLTICYLNSLLINLFDYHL